jgi:hydrogenase maturation protease
VSSFVSSTHAFGLAEAIALGDVLHQLPDELIVYGVEGVRFEPGSTPSDEVLWVVRRVCERVLSEATAVCTAVETVGPTRDVSLPAFQGGRS